MNEQEWNTWDMTPYFKGSGYGTGTGKSYIVIETWEGPNLPFQGKGFLGLDFEDDTPVETMREVINLLNRHISRVTFTGPERLEWVHVQGRSRMLETPPKPHKLTKPKKEPKR